MINLVLIAVAVAVTAFLPIALVIAGVALVVTAGNRSVFERPVESDAASRTQ